MFSTIAVITGVGLHCVAVYLLLRLSPRSRTSIEDNIVHQPSKELSRQSSTPQQYPTPGAPGLPPSSIGLIHRFLENAPQIEACESPMLKRHLELIRRICQSEPPFLLYILDEVRAEMSTIRHESLRPLLEMLCVGSGVKLFWPKRGDRFNERQHEIRTQKKTLGGSGRCVDDIIQFGYETSRGTPVRACVNTREEYE